VISSYAIIHVPRTEHQALLQRIAGWLQPGGLLVATMGAMESEGMEDDWLGAPMYWSHFDAETNQRLVASAGLEIVDSRLDIADEDGQPVTHLWIVARKPRGSMLRLLLPETYCSFLQADCSFRLQQCRRGRAR
jgi:hypothetical protein